MCDFQGIPRGSNIMIPCCWQMLRGGDLLEGTALPRSLSPHTLTWLLTVVGGFVIPDEIYTDETKTAIHVKQILRYRVTLSKDRTNV